MSNTQNKEALELEAERVAAENWYEEYTSKGWSVSKIATTTAFKAGIDHAHARAQLAAPAGAPEDVLSLLKDARWRIANKPQHGAAKADFERLDRPVLARIDAMLAAPPPAPARHADGQVNIDQTLFNEIRTSEPVNEDGEPA